MCISALLSCFVSTVVCLLCMWDVFLKLKSASAQEMMANKMELVTRLNGVVPARKRAQTQNA